MLPVPQGILHQRIGFAGNHGKARGHHARTTEFLNNLAHYGNTISSSVPTLMSRLDEVLGRNELRPLREGDHLILLAAGICMEQIDDFMSAGHACIRWSPGVLNAPAIGAATATHLGGFAR